MTLPFKKKKEKNMLLVPLSSTCQLQVPTNYQDVTQWRHCNACNAGAIRISSDSGAGQQT